MRDALRKARKAKGLTVADMAKMLRISPSFYYKIEQGVRNPTLELAKSIADTVGRSVEEVFFASGFASGLDKAPNDEQAAALDATGT
ncbi:MAG: helix-turn-helix transcriptional regulator [Bacillota bacterium]